MSTRAPLGLPEQANERWSLDFASDALSDSRRFRILAVVDDFSRESLALVSDTWLSGVRLVRELDRIAAQRGYPCQSALNVDPLLEWAPLEPDRSAGTNRPGDRAFEG